MNMFTENGDQDFYATPFDESDIAADIEQNASENLFPDLDDAMLNDCNELLNEPSKPILTQSQVSLKKPPAIYKIKLNSSNELHKLLNIANTINKKPQNSLVSSSSQAKGSKSIDTSNGSMSKNAVAARENRQKKKKYVENLELSVQRLRSENSDLRVEMKKTKTKLTSYEKEILYLRNVLSNVNEISALIKNVKKTPGINLNTSMKQPKQNDKNGLKKRKKYEVNVSDEVKKVRRSDNIDSGVCLHVAKNNISLEFCNACSSRAKNSLGVPSDCEKNEEIEDSDLVYLSDD